MDPSSRISGNPTGGERFLPPRDDADDWRIELKYDPIFHRGHAFLVLVDHNNDVKAELHGMAFSRFEPPSPFQRALQMGPDGSNLRGVVYDSYLSGIAPSAKSVGVVARGSYDDIVRDRWVRGQRAADEITRRDFDYKGHDPSYEFGTNGGQIQNSNSAAYTFGRAMGLDLDSAIRSSNNERRFPGWGRDLLNPGYKRYVAPPQFPTDNRP